MIAGQHDMVIEQGATFLRTCQYKDASGTPVNLTGRTVAAKARYFKEATGAALITFTCTIANAMTGTFTIGLTSTETAALDFIRAFYDVELTVTATGAVVRLLEGTVILSKEVTR